MCPYNETRTDLRGHLLTSEVPYDLGFELFTIHNLCNYAFLAGKWLYFDKVSDTPPAPLPQPLSEQATDERGAGATRS